MAAAAVAADEPMLASDEPEMSAMSFSSRFIPSSNCCAQAALGISRWGGAAAMPGMYGSTSTREVRRCWSTWPTPAATSFGVSWRRMVASRDRLSL